MWRRIFKFKFVFNLCFMQYIILIVNSLFPNKAESLKYRLESLILTKLGEKTLVLKYRGGGGDKLAIHYDP